MPDAWAQYSVRCSRERSGCQRCQTDGIQCCYTRSGVIRRARRHRHDANAAAAAVTAPTSPAVSDPHPSGPPSGNRDGTAYDHSQQHIPSRNQHSIRAIGSLLEEYATAWKGSEAFERLGQPVAHTCSFREEQIQSWINAFVNTLARERLLLVSAPPEVLDQLASSCPHLIQDRAWLVMFYSIALSVEFSSDASDESTKSQLKSNLWLAFNHVRLLIEPAATSIQALVIMVSYAEEYMTPSVSCSLITTACVMLQSLGMTHWSLDSATSERRTALFWRLNLLDKELALILCRPPIFHREMANVIALPTLGKAASIQQNDDSNCRAVMFEAHYNNQMHLLSRVKADVWHVLYGQDGEKILAIKESLASWYRQAKQLLEAAALVEKPFLAANDAEVVDFGLQMLYFHYLSVLVLLTVSNKNLRSKAIHPAQEMLNLLTKLGGRVIPQSGPFTCLLWQYLHCPLAAFGALWGEIVIKADAGIELRRQWMEVIEQLPRFLGQLSSRNSLAGKLQSITTRMVEHARATLDSPGTQNYQKLEQQLQLTAATLRGKVDASSQDMHSHTPPHQSMGKKTVGFNTFGGGDFDTPFEENLDFVNDPFWDATFDWFAWPTEDPAGWNS